MTSYALIAMHDKYKKRFRDSRDRDDGRTRRKIAVEAARRLIETLGLQDGDERLAEVRESDYYSAKRKAAAVLGQRVRPGDLPSDAEVREQTILFLRSARPDSDADERASSDDASAEDDIALHEMADHLDRFAIYKMRLLPLETIKLDPIHHPEGDALFHSLQVFERARDARPYDEEFMLAALLHDIGKAIDPRNSVAAALEALRGSISERTAWLIEHWRDHHDDRRKKPPPDPDWLDDLAQLRQADLAGRVPGMAVGTIDETLEYLKELESEDYLD